MDQNTAASLDGALDETIAFREMLEQILVLYVVHFDRHVLEAIEETLLYRQLQYRQYMRDTSLTK